MSLLYGQMLRIAVISFIFTPSGSTVIFENTTSPGSSTSLATTVTSNVTTGSTVIFENTTSPGSSTSLATTVTSNVTTDVYYWMVLTVNVNGDLKNESDIDDWLSGLFETYLDTCSPVLSNGTMLTDTLQTSSVSSTYLAASSQFQGLEATCANKTDIRSTQCNMLLKLRNPMLPCCFQRALMLGAQNSSIQAQIVGNRVERVGAGLCDSQLPPINGLANCDPFLNSTFSPPNMCNSKGPVNISCGQDVSVSVPLGNQTQMNCSNSTETLVANTTMCNCSSYCTSTDTYYTFGIQITDPTINISYIYYLMNVLQNTLLCNNSSENGPSCLLPNISTINQDTNVQCIGEMTNLQSCRIIVRLNMYFPVCEVNTALMAVFSTEQNIGYNGQVTQAGICGSPGPNGDLLDSAFIYLNFSITPLQFCGFEESFYITGCNQGTNICVLLNEVCVPNVNTSPSPITNITLPANTTMLSPPPYTTLQPNTTSTALNTTTSQPNTTSTALNTTTSQPNTNSTALNTTTSQPNTTSTALNTTTSQPNTNSTALNTTTSQPNAISQGNTTANTSAPIVPPANATAAPSDSTSPPVIMTTPASSTTAGSNEQQANNLLDLTKDVSALNTSQVNQLVSQLEALLAGPNVSLALGNTSLNIVSNLLGASPDVLASSSTQIIGIVDTVGLKLVVQQEVSILTKSVALAVKTVDGSNFQQTSFSIPDPNSVQIRDVVRARRSMTEASSLPQGSVTFPSTLTANLSPEQQLQASRLQFNFYQKSTVFQDPALGSSRLNSGILGASVANLSIQSLRDDVVITLRNTEPIPANFVVSCAFWDFSVNGGSGGWNRNGCSVQNSTDNETVCACNHLTSFGVLLDLSRTGITSPLQDTILTYITYIGCGVSAIFLSVTLLTYLAFGKLRKDIPSKILIQLCLALLFLNLVFLLDSWLALYPNAKGLCISTAWFLHYFLLASFTWMGLEAVHMYIALVKVFNTYISNHMLKFSLVGWGVPLLVVIIVIAIDKDNYGLVGYAKYSDGTPSDDFCWLKNDIAFYVAVVAYFCVIFLFNLIMFVVVMVQLCRIKRQNPHNTRHRNGVQDLRSVIGLTLLLGLSWGFAFFAWGPVNLAFMYLFAIFNSFQGFFIFVFHCAVKENVRRQWRTYLCCGRLRLAENSEWSRTATQKTEKKSVSANTRVISLSSDNSSRSNNSFNSSILASDPQERPAGGIGSPFHDRTITALEEPSSDVVFNEINNQFRTQRYRTP
ncbi:adhesion G-protein coupled receptor G2 isoform X2 [Esox lucius]|uniref:adhesion G-protein coupled receptor G2 isoform X2 n=1 Tax=Esox lucius TaxID=8010 RepID=UPI001476E84D|nr:adhesion G-protein coupled receptor G2 isoform X2 [Esox lucius]